MTEDDNGSGTFRGNEEITEDALVDKIRSRFGGTREGSLGIGDDAAILSDPRPAVLTTDILIEEIDFFTTTPRWFVGRKALSANLSDLAAMGAEPDSFLLTLATPRSQLATLEDLLDGMAEKASDFRIALAGGDLSEAERMIVSITAIGRVRSGRALLRSEARPGDSLFVSRPLGGPAAGLELLRKGWSLDRNLDLSTPRDVSYEIRELGASVLRSHLDPTPEVELGLALAKLDEAGACIDLSDGVSRDLARICEASGVGAVIDWERVPTVPDLDRLGPRLGVDPFRCALHGGEEFSLLFTARSAEAQLSQTLGRPVYRIGKIEKGGGVRLNRAGRVEPLPPLSFDHFGG
ncbi:MAG: thiamine-phosphate kinase [Thermoanaerobaculia bacterium]|nr:thiamine-phosphate kinase [Thermoanaerobaculia bacterium]